MFKKRILLLNYEFPPIGGGGGIASLELAQGFIENGFEVDVVTTWFKGLKEYEKKSGLNIYRVKVPFRTNINTASLPSLILYPIVAYNKTVDLCLNNKYSFINAHFAVPTGVLGVVVSKRFGLPLITSLHGGDIYDPTKNISPHKNIFSRKIVEWVLNNSYFVVAQSSDTLNKAKKYYSFNSKSCVIPLPYKIKKFKRISRAKIGLNKEDFVLISIGRLVKRKGFDFLIKSFAKTNLPNSKLLIIGDGPEKNSLVSLVAELGVKDRIIFLGSLFGQKKFQYLSNANVFVLSSSNEPFGVCLQEAIQCGLPIISTRMGGQEEVLSGFGKSFFVDYGDEEKLSNIINDLSKYNKKVTSYESTKRLYGFSPKKISKKYISLLD